MNQDDTAQISKFLSYILRHQPQSIGLSLDENGWASIDDLIDCAGNNGRKLTRAAINHVVETSDKKRFALSDDGNKIRANQGHSFEVDLNLAPVMPPPQLFHGTATRFLDSILANGLIPSGRQYVHLSPDVATAIQIGKRHGKPVVLVVATELMSRGDHLFYRSENGVWLTKHVPPQFLKLLENH